MLPFIHAVAGCNTTSRLFNVGKGKSLEKLDTSPLFKERALLFCSNIMSDRDPVISAGVEAIVCLYSGIPGEGLGNLRIRKFKKPALTSFAELDVKTLPPTDDAAKYHALRVFLQVRC